MLQYNVPMKIPWYHKTTIYQIYPRSFFDTNADGIGDLQGIIQKLDYIHDLGFETIWISPFFASPQADFGYDISDYTEISPEYGGMEDVLQLIREVHRRDMRIVLDMVMNHTSDQHTWFKESASSRDNPRADWYIWRDQPTNWQSLTGGSGWHFYPRRGQYYWASFLPFQPDLNYHNPEVKQAMFDVVRFWLKTGVDGFRLDIFNAIYKDAEFRNNPFAWRLVPTEDDPSGFFQTTRYNLNLPESFAFAEQFRAVCDEFGEKLSVGEVSGNRGIIRKYLGGENNSGLTLVFDFEMLKFKFSADYFRKMIQTMEQAYPEPFMPVYVFSNHDRSRSMERLGHDPRKAKVLAMFQLTVRGIPCFYYGEEIGMTDSPLPMASALDPVPHKFKYIPEFIFKLLGITLNRDVVRTPMQWDGDTNGGFSRAEKTWLPVNGNRTEVNVQRQLEENDSLLNTIRGLNQIRKEERLLREGTLEILPNMPEDVLGYARSDGTGKLLVLLNFSNQPRKIQLAYSDLLFKLAGDEEIQDGGIRLGGLGGAILKD
jgi:oligo-1,6-glucosidase/alpha-glucosidase